MSNIIQHSNFEVEQVEQQTLMGSVTKHYLVFRRNLDETIINYLKTILDDEDELYNDPVKITPDDLYPHIKTIQNRIETSEDFSLLELADWLRTFYQDKLEQLERMNQDGKINFNNLESIFPIGTKCIGKILDQEVGFIVSSNNRGTDHFGTPIFNLIGRVTFSNGDKFKQIDKTFQIQQFRGAVTVEQLDIRPITEEELQNLTERGRKMIKYGLSATYASYVGSMFRKTQYGIYKFKADGRIMIDPTGFKKNNPSYPLLGSHNNSFDCQSVPDDLLFMCYPFCTGFSFSSKQWGEIYIENVSDISYYDKAFDYLVLEDSIKKMVKALICNSEGVFGDIISGKSKSTIMCLSGPPGTGKTLLSESISEFLHKPLYSISSGELGTSVDILEKKLNEILELAYAWNAIILIDEADIFMEERSTNDIQRNAMVSVFLRLLERYQGIMFLTTNRPDNFDPAFKSRISISIKYKELDKETRFKIWTNLLGASNIFIENEEIHELSETQMNGRQIKNAIRMSQCLANDSGSNVTKEVVKAVLPFII